MKHPYDPACTCPRCQKEAARRDAQATTNARWHAIGRRATRPHRKLGTRRPVPGSQEWAETRGDDLGESEDR